MPLLFSSQGIRPPTQGINLLVYWRSSAIRVLFLLSQRGSRTSSIDQIRWRTRNERVSSRGRQREHEATNARNRLGWSRFEEQVFRNLTFEGFQSAPSATSALLLHFERIARNATRYIFSLCDVQCFVIFSFLSSPFSNNFQMLPIKRTSIFITLVCIFDRSISKMRFLD